MHARVTTLDMDPARVDEARDQLERDDVPAFKKLDGFKGMTLLTERQTGKPSRSPFGKARMLFDRARRL
jgi:hypothetical protein